MTSTIAYKNFVANTIKTLEKTVEQQKKKLEYVRDNGSTNDNFTMTQITKLNFEIDSNQGRIQDFQSFQTDLDKGKFSEELKDEYDATHSTIAQGPKKVKIQPTKKVPFVPNPAEKRQNYVNYNKEYRKYQIYCSKVPHHINKNLKNMPNNKGYIYNGIYLYGEQHAYNYDTTIMFEKKNKDTLTIHEITPTQIKIMTKKTTGKNNKQKVQSITPRRKITTF